MGLELIDERVEEAGPRLVYTAPARDINAEITAAQEQGYAAGMAEADARWRERFRQRPPRAPLAAELIPILDRLSVLVGIRVMLFVALVATFALAWVAMQNPTPAALTLVGMFGAITMGPLAWLATRRTG